MRTCALAHSISHPKFSTAVKADSIWSTTKCPKLSPKLGPSRRCRGAGENSKSRGIGSSTTAGDHRAARIPAPVCVCVCVCVCVLCVCVRIYIHMYMCGYKQMRMCVIMCLNVCISVCIYVRVYVRIYMYWYECMVYMYTGGDTGSTPIRNTAISVHSDT